MTTGFVTGVLVDAGRSARAETRFLATAVAIASLPGLLAVALLPPDAARGPALVSAAITLYLQLLATARTLDRLGAMPGDYVRADATERRYPSAFLGSILFLLAVGLGLALLVLPGVAVFLLWGLWMPALLAERLGVIAAFRRSYALARPRLSAMLAVAALSAAGFVAAIVPPVAVAMANYLLGGPYWVDRLGDAAAEVTVSAFLIGNAVLWAAAFVRARSAA